ncbi:TPR-like protein [Rhizoctonia solani]|uniref:TPR-like protein n=1 Tax=Rhizoctonia solani TaxID=456999 RepID=A0A8H7GZV5_9AGAM|nr:TPR-like protein [Rhizoctonia solani]
MDECAESNRDTLESRPNLSSDNGGSLESALSKLKFNNDPVTGSLSLQELRELGKFHFDQFLRSGNLDNITKAIEYQNRVLEATPGEDKDKPILLDDLMACYRTQFNHLKRLTDMEKMHDCGVQALALTPRNDPHLPYRHANLGRSYGSRYYCLGEIPDLDKAIECFSRALDLTPYGHPHLRDRYGNLGAWYHNRYKRLGKVADLEKSIEHMTRAVTLTPDGHPDLPDRHSLLGMSYSDRHERLGKLADLEKAIECQTCAMDFTPEGHPKLADRYNNLGLAYTKRHERLRKLADLEKAIKCNARALELTPEGDYHLPIRHNNMGATYIYRYQSLREMNDLEKATESFSHAIDLTPDGDPDLPGRHANLGASYIDRHNRLGELADLEKAIDCFSHALKLTPDSHPDLAHWHHSLGVSYKCRYKRLGKLADLEKAMEFQSSALGLTPDGHPCFPARHTNLGGSYGLRYKHLGELADLGKAIEFHTRALDLTPDGHPDMPLRYGNLGASYNDRYQRLGKLVDLEKAIECNTRALDLTPDSHPHLPAMHANLGTSYNDRYRHLGELADLDKAIELQARALDLTPDGHPDLPLRYVYLGVSHSDRYKCLSDPAELEKAVECETRAFNLTPDDHPDMPDRHLHFAKSCLVHYLRSHDTSHLDKSLRSFRRASQLSTGIPRKVFQNACTWANFACRLGYLNPIEAFRTTIDLLPHFIWLGATTNQRYQDLSLAKDLAVRAACSAIHLSEYTLAVEWVEHARCVVWNQSLMLRTPVDDLQLSHPDLATQLQSVSQQLHHATSGSSPPGANSSSAHAPERRHRLAREYNELLQLVCNQPGFERFLQPTKSDDLLRAARYGPIVIINCHEVHCNALAILPGQDRVGHLSLPNCTQQKAQSARSEIERLLRSKGIREREHRMKFRQVGETEPNVGPVLASLWYNVVKPILEYLGYTNDSPINHLPHITWCPTGVMSFLPLHAAGDYDKPRSRVFDYVISSYTPTLSAMLTSTSTSAVIDRAPRILAIGQAATPKCSPLPGTDKELEHLKAHAEGRTEYSQLTDDGATTTAVLDAMDQHDWVHLACHAQQNAMDPTKSGFYLHDGTLDLSAITQRSFRGKGLAFLSACQTARGDESLPDEVIHLASGMLMAGYPSVIGTMWSVVDEDTPFVADKVYAQLMENGKVGSGEAGKALHYAVAGLRDQIGEREFARWIPYIHIGS